MKQVVKIVRLRYPNDKSLSADIESKKITFVSKTGVTRVEQSGAGDLEYLPMLGDLYEFKKVTRIDMDMIAGTFKIIGVDRFGNPKTENPTT